jgi:serine/threonine-protein kinase HipA
MAEIIRENWKQALIDEGASRDDVRVYTDAFEHVEADKAMKSSG